MKTTKDKIRLLTFFALCQNMLDFIDGSWHGHPANKQAVKMVTKQMVRELEKTMAILFPPNRNDDPELPDALDTFQNACTAMESFFMLGMEMEPYYKLAEQYGYRVSTIIVENRHGSSSVHDVPSETIDKMRNRFQIKL